jgi:ABC-type branched-subunit amino acid transport system ATPase component
MNGEACWGRAATFVADVHPMLHLEGIVKRYGDHTALDGITMDVPTGKVFGLLGPNGAGKTTLIRIITRITGPDEGRVLLEGRPMTNEDVAHLGYLPERPFPRRGQQAPEGMVRALGDERLVEQESGRAEQGHGAEGAVHHHRDARAQVADPG